MVEDLDIDLGLSDLRLSVEKLQEFFQMIYELDLQVEQEGDHIDDLMTSLAFSECLFFFRLMDFHPSC